MSDEEIGRKWCAANGKRPYKSPEGYSWKCDDGSWLFANPETLVDRLAFPAPKRPTGFDTFPTEAEAYAALGNALRSLWAFAEASKGQVQA